MERMCIIVRHGEAHKVRYGDGPLTDIGHTIVEATSEKLGKKLVKKEINKIDLAIVSGAIRCIDTYSIIAENFFCESEILIEKSDIQQQYFATFTEKTEWKKLFFGEKSKEYFSDCEKIGERRAIMRHVPHIVNAYVDRIIKRIQIAKNAETILVVTHGPHDAILAEKLTGKYYEGLEKGKGRIITL